MEEKNTKSRKRVLYYVILSVCALLLVAGIVLTVYFVTTNTTSTLETPPVDGPSEPVGPDDPNDPNIGDPGFTGPSDPVDPEPGEPSGGDAVRFVAPLEYETLAVEYAQIYHNETTGWWYRHRAVDFSADAGTAVVCMADGTVESVSISKELGNLIVIDHGDGLKTMYRFVEPVETLKEGAAVKKGEKLGAVAEAYGSEAFQGAHLHLEIQLGNDLVDPTDYLDSVLEEK